MRTHETSAPNAAELYVNNGIYGQLYELLAESLGRSKRRAAQPRPEATSGKPRPHATSVQPQSAQPAAVAHAASRTTLLDRLDTWFWRQAQQQQEAYLAQSRDVFELERRIRALERGEITPYY